MSDARKIERKGLRKLLSRLFLFFPPSLFLSFISYTKIVNAQIIMTPSPHLHARTEKQMVGS